MRTISVRLDDGSEARLDNLCQPLGLSQSEVVMAGLLLLQQQSTSPAAPGGTPRAGWQLRQHYARQRHHQPGQGPCRPAAADTGSLVAWFDRSDQDH
jgi:hypothetical protein